MKLLGHDWKRHKVGDYAVVRKEEKQTEIAISLLDMNRSVVSRVISGYMQRDSVENRPRTGSLRKATALVA